MEIERISKDEFVKILKKIQDDWDFYSLISSLGHKNNREDTLNISPKTVDVAIELLEKLSGDRYEYISWWCFEKDFGRRVDINVYEGKGEDQIVPTDTAEDLYDLITQNLQEKAS